MISLICGSKYRFNYHAEFSEESRMARRHGKTETLVAKEGIKRKKVQLPYLCTILHAEVLGIVSGHQN